MRPQFGRQGRARVLAVLPAARGLALALLLGTLGGAAFYELNGPLPWMLGSMLACGLGALLKLPLAVPPAVRPPVTALIGTMLGTTFTAHTFARAGEWLLPIGGMVLFVITAGLASYVYFRRVGGFDRPTSFFAGMPGGIVEMVLIGGERGGDERMIALVHAARVFLVVLLIPFLVELSIGTSLPRAAATAVPFSALGGAGALWFAATLVTGMVVGRLLRLPVRPLFGPLLVSALVHAFGLTDFALPSVLVAAAQVVLGAIIGCRFAATAPAMILRVLALSVGATVLLLAVTFGFAFLVSKATGVSVVNLVLAYSPGGLAEMSLVALALNGEVAFVLVHHLIRVGVVVSLSALLYRLVDRATSD
jgi:membrane AbrB-like protein